MRIIRFLDERGGTHWGVREGDQHAIVLDLQPGAELKFNPTARRERIARLLPPVDPPNIVCVGRNYRSNDASEDRGAEPIGTLEVFLKPTTALAGPGEAIAFPAIAGDGDPLLAAEGELAVVIARACWHVREDHVMAHVLGFTAANDITARRWQTQSGPPLWMRGKGFDGFCPVGPELVTCDELGDVNSIGLRTMVNGEVVREGSTSRMIRSVSRLVSELSMGMTLLQGTVVLTGAPAATAAAAAQRPLRPDDEVVVEINGIGRLVNRVGPAMQPSVFY